MPLSGATQGQHNWWTKGLGGSRRTLRNWTGGWTTAKSVAQEGRKVKPILPTTPSWSTDRKTSRTNLTGLKPAEDFFFFPSSFPPEFLLPFCPSFFFYSFFLPSFIYSFVLIFIKIPSFFKNILIDYAITVVPSPTPSLHSILPTSSLPHSYPIVHVHGPYL